MELFGRARFALTKIALPLGSEAKRPFGKAMGGSPGAAYCLEVNRSNFREHIYYEVGHVDVSAGGHLFLCAVGWWWILSHDYSSLLLVSLFGVGFTQQGT